MASRSVNKVILLGRLGRDAETAFTASQVAVTKFSVATTRRWKDQASGDWKEETDWTNVVLWRMEKLAPYLLKGSQIYIEGRLQMRSYEKDGRKVYVTEVVAEEVILVGNNASGERRESAPVSAPRSYQPPASPGEQPAFDEEEIPF